MVIEEDIRIRSYLLWEAAGRPRGQDVEFWLQAEADLAVEARYAPKQSIQIAVAMVPRARVHSPPQRIVAMRVPLRSKRQSVSAAMR